MQRIDPHYLQNISHVVDCLPNNPCGEIDSLLLTDGTEVHLSLNDDKERGVPLYPGAALAAHGPGVAADGLPMLDAKETGATLNSLQPMRPKKSKDCTPPKHSEPDGGKGRRAPKHA